MPSNATPVDIQIVAYPLDAGLEQKLTTLMNAPATQGYRLISSFSPPVADGQIMVYFVFQKGG